MSSGQGVPQKDQNDCPKCGRPATPSKEERPALVDRALDCAHCGDTYILVRGRWWSTR